LNLAECRAALGDTDGALDNLNIVRKRAGIPELTSADLTEEMPLEEWVRNERFIELWAEGHRYFDLRRWCLAPQYLKAGVREGLNFTIENPTFEQLNQRTVVNQPFEWNERMYLLPIATAEKDSNPQLVQAPGY
ncbi:MAG: RagB/SusD family nutrient uptake outer membrane protein, partial [Candidatus Cryptobacteroides sp.]